ncbi:Crp/Fnr family transcriptional regulator [Chitinophaga ginsengisegetis]|uniref:Crp/Fnr family transcriptional regulator n=1 Tax=Chitinophaga ginsengisegetis TaxID=393003 RepID=UPI000DB9AB37|nr:Crp/Fnr family transcriptional regulator [Chitinophaga ginsengisegetis]MDR6569488.1 CRP-like cAMP-binding protein [Chitinophaga ginsengisegetis]MDR6649221.1 CRP-like cAMP-binding protein [Chitinophaga ginsengisegetis]MDR6655571.1 CRP-like cAMP-binding protein [Chitinophaga ginsengisegetis]
MQGTQIIRQQLQALLQEPIVHWELFKAILQPVTFPAGDHLSEAGKTANAIYYIEEGVVRVYTLHDGKDISMDFAFPHNFTTSYASFITQKPAAVSLQAVTPVSGYACYYADLQQLYRTSHQAEKIGRLIAEQQYLRKYNRELSFLQYSAQERYTQLLHEHPEVVQHIPVKQIASYLGIEPESLSRIRKKRST